MNLRLHDTGTRSVRDFTPRVSGSVGVYLCGLTVQSPPHIGHLRSGVNNDVLRRWLTYNGMDVSFVRNITDIDDKILAKALEQDRPYWTIAYANERLLAADYAALNVLEPTYEPRATGHIPEMMTLITELIEKGHAYQAADGSGDVYFDVLSFGEYGKLSGQRVDHMQAAADGPVRAKRDPRDFALWKGPKDTEPQNAYWDTRYGRGRPGWHLECSAMARRYLGDTFDIHGGGVDLVFPHHENEVAQSRAAGLGFARYWVHNAMVNLGNEKMSKSVGNVIDLDSLRAFVRPIEVRYYLAVPHYRSVIEYSEDALRDSAAGFRRIEGFVQRAAERVGADDIRPDLGALAPEFEAALNDDLNTSGAMAAVHDAVREGNTACDAGDVKLLTSTAASVRRMLDIFGLDPLAPQWTKAGGGDDLRSTLDALVALTLEQRQAARSRRDYATSDMLRDQLTAAGVQVEDTPHGPRWTYETTKGN
ncbi:cysteine--tRNA ligase [Actinorhabdospora filicis]|uniref:Cysteine--tRNA ligase n=1 Tax=Actinorhabdospora filicis TaxID=1785913 RepID=A0A9W6SJG9_9ACTN|nr:cysteine--tRNA ligase [Actinorhabdospora filicis]GLZ76937.1 cysteine--tRNA ligase [Actinorhabdospora filicis]